MGVLGQKMMNMNLLGIIAVFVALALIMPSASAQLDIKVVTEKVLLEKTIVSERMTNFVGVVSVDAVDDNIRFTDETKNLDMSFEGYDATDKLISLGTIKSFEIVMDSSDPARYKFSYKFLLPDEKFIVKVRVTSDDSMRLLEGDYLVIGENKLVSFRDVLDYDFQYSVDLVNPYLAVVTITKDWTKFGIKVGDMVLIDPYVISYPVNDGYLERDEYGVFDVYLTDTTLRVGNNDASTDLIYRSYLKFNTSVVEPWDDLINATFHGRVVGETCNAGNSSQFWLQNISDYGDLGESDWDMTYENLDIFYSAPDNATGFYTADATGGIVKGGISAFRIMGTYELYGGVNCWIAIRSNESTDEPYIELYYNDGSPDAPDIMIHSPLNQSYPYETLPLEVSSYGGAGGVDAWWYSLDGGVTNTTFIPNTSIVAGLGSNCIDVWLNNTYGSESHNQTCFTVSSYGTDLACWIDPVSFPAGNLSTTYCNYTYAVNGTAIDGNYTCQRKLNTTVITQRFTGSLDGYHSIYGDDFGGYSVYLSSAISDVGGGARIKCTDNTAHGLDVYLLVSDTNPYDNLNGSHNITAHNYTYLLYENVSCDYLDLLFGVKGSFADMNLVGNDTVSNGFISQLGNPAMAYRGFFYGCPDCTGVGGDEWYIAYDIDNTGHSYAGNLSQTSDWSLCPHEHMQWLYFNTDWVNLTFDALSGLHEGSWVTSVWALAGQRQMLADCSLADHQSQSDVLYFNVTGVDAPTCSIDTYDLEVPVGFNQTFSWSSYSPTPFLVHRVWVKNNNDTVYQSCDAGNHSFLINESGGYTIECYVSNIMGSDTDSALFSSSELDYNIELYYSPYVGVDRQTTIYAFLIVNGTSVHLFSKISITIDNITADMVWVADDSAYEVYWIPTEEGVYPFTVHATPFDANGSITVSEPFNITIRLWNNINMTEESRYLNEFAWIYFTKDLNPTLKRLFGRDRFACPPQGSNECFWHGEYVNGTAVVTLYETGNYSMYIIGNNIKWRQPFLSGGLIECEFCEPSVIQSRFRLNLGDYYLDKAEEFDLYYSNAELYVFGAVFGTFASWLSMALFAGIGLGFFLLLLFTTGSLKSALAGLVLLPTIIFLILKMVLW